MYIDQSFGFQTAFSEATKAIRAAHVEATGAPNGIGLVKLNPDGTSQLSGGATIPTYDQTTVSERALVTPSFVPQADAPHVALLRRAGAVIIGKTNTPEFGAGSQTFNPVFGPTRNPLDTRLTPGGSSGGTAAPT